MFRWASFGPPKPKVLVELKDMPRWPAYWATLKASKDYEPASEEFVKAYAGKYTPNAAVNEKIVLYRGDITALKIDGIVNAANDGLWAGGGICGAIHSAAGPELERECETAYPRGCDTGSAVVTAGYNLPSKFVFHAVGPTNGDARKLQSCYYTCLDLMVAKGVRSLAFCCIATGIFGFPNDNAAEIALVTAREWLTRDNGANAAKIDAIIFCTFLPKDQDLYHSYTPVIFPVAEGKDGVAATAPATTAATATATAAAPAAASSSSATAPAATATASSATAAAAAAPAAAATAPTGAAALPSTSAPVLAKQPSAGGSGATASGGGGAAAAAP